MSRDGPSSGRIGFGFREAVKAGAPFVRPSSNAELNLKAFVERRPELGLRVAALLKSGWRASAILEELREEGLDGMFALALWRDADGEDWVRTDYSDDREKLEKDARWSLAQGACKSACLWGLDAHTREWRELKAWPDGAE